MSTPSATVSRRSSSTGDVTPSLSRRMVRCAIWRMNSTSRRKLEAGADANNNVILNCNGSTNPILDAAHLISGDPAAGNWAPTFPLRRRLAGLCRTAHQVELRRRIRGGIERQVGGFVSAPATWTAGCCALSKTPRARLLRVPAVVIPQNFVMGNSRVQQPTFSSTSKSRPTPAGGPPADCPV